MKIADCYECGEPVWECTQWDISCENCNKEKTFAHNNYLENAAWLKEHTRKIKK